MSDYTQITSFGPKDSLTTGDPNKKIRGTQLDPEFAAISAAILSKYDSNDLANDATAAALTSATTLITPATLAYALQNGTLTLGADISLAKFPNVTGEVTATQAELNVLDGITATTAELNKLDGYIGNTLALNNLFLNWAGINFAFAVVAASTGPTNVAKNISGASHTPGSGTYTIDYTEASFLSAPAVFIVCQNPNVSTGIDLRTIGSRTATSVTYTLENRSGTLSDSDHFFFAIGVHDT